MAELLKGAPVARALTERLSARADALEAVGVTPRLAVIRVGEPTSAACSSAARRSA